MSFVVVGTSNTCCGFVVSCVYRFSCDFAMGEREFDILNVFRSCCFFFTAGVRSLYSCLARMDLIVSMILDGWGGVHVV